MAQIVGAIATSHIPAIGKAIAENKQNDPYWKPFFDGYGPALSWLKQARPDVVVMIYNDHGLNFFLDKMPTFAVGAAAQYRSEDEGWGLPVLNSFPGDAALSWHIIEHLVADEFDITSCQDMAVDHGFAVPMNLLFPNAGGKWPVTTVPVSINTVQHPLPTPLRCWKLGRAIGRAIESYPKDLRVVVFGTGGLSHQLDGTRAGFINKKFDLYCLDTIVRDPEALTKLSVIDLVREAGAQGVEFLNWITMRGALLGNVSQIHRNYHIPISNTAGATLVLENRTAAQSQAA
ncbi:MAG: protocatechuate 3,4-dioxygenase [Proteobacteria bacterium]|nr:protocatechuate 3,4-dioxygenase [Pseudomonadota bacterium]